MLCEVIRTFFVLERGENLVGDYVIYVLHKQQEIEVAIFKHEFYELGCLFLDLLRMNDVKHSYGMHEKG